MGLSQMLGVAGAVISLLGAMLIFLGLVIATSRFLKIGITGSIARANGRSYSQYRNDQG
jgi:hypothetical protein